MIFRILTLVNTIVLAYISWSVFKLHEVMLDLANSLIFMSMVLGIVGEQAGRALNGG